MATWASCCFPTATLRSLHPASLQQGLAACTSWRPPGCLYALRSSHTPPLQVAGHELFRLQLWQGKTDGLSADEDAPPELSLLTLALGCRSAEQSLPQLLSCLQPPGAPRRQFERLELSGALPSATAVAGCSQLCQLQALSLSGMWDAMLGGRIERAIEGLLQQASRLSSLAVSSEAGYAQLGSVPPRLAGYRGLTSLVLKGHILTELPAGGYLAGGCGAGGDRGLRRRPQFALPSHSVGRKGSSSSRACRCCTCHR